VFHTPSLTPESLYFCSFKRRSTPLTRYSQLEIIVGEGSLIMKKRTRKPYISSDTYFNKLLKDPEIRMYYEEDYAKTRIAMAIRGLRKKAHLTQAQMARRMKTTQSAVARLESARDSRIPSLAVLSQIAVACGTRFEFGFRPRKA